MADLLSKPVPNEAAAQFLAAKPVVSREVFDRLLPELQGRAFVITGVENANVVQSVRDLIAEVPRGGDWDKLKEEIAGKISPYLGDGAERRAELLLRQQGYQSYQAAQYEVMDRQSAAFPFWQYQSAEDGSVRETHAALNGVVMPADSPFWDAHYPPWEWGCRCYVVPLTAEDVADMQRADAALPPEQRRVLDVDQRQRLETSGVVQRAPDGGVPRAINVTPRADAPRFDPQSLRLGADELRTRYDAQTWSVFETWAKAQPLDLGAVAGRTVWEWMNAPRAGRAVRERRTPRAQRVAPAAPAPVNASQPLENQLEETRQRVTATAEAERAAIQTAGYKSAQVIGGNHVNTAVILKNGRKVVFKAREGEYRTIRQGVPQGTQYQREIGASIIDDELGMGLVPPTALLSYKGETGSAQLFRDGYRTADSFKNPYAVARQLPDRVKHDWQLMDDLLNHLDRHPGNYMFRVQGTQVELALIDHGHTLASVGGQAKRVAGPMESQAIDATNRLRLESLLRRETEVRARLEAVLDRPAVDLFFARVRGLLQRGTYGDI